MEVVTSTEPHTALGEGESGLACDAVQSIATVVHRHDSVAAPDASRAINWAGHILKRRYKILARLGSGGMSDVYLATDMHLEKTGSKDCRVAIKILRSSLTQDFSAISFLAKEAAKSKQLSHPNIIRVYDLEYDCDIWFMVMELLDGEPLSKIIQRSKPCGLKWKGVSELILQIYEALIYSHGKGIVHADLKPSNIFVTSQGTVKLLDFGVAQALKSDQPVDFLSQQVGAPDETTLYGYTPAYASPSLYAGNPPSPADDWYGLACITYELISSNHPFDRKRPDDEALANVRLLKPRHCPGQLWQLLQNILSGDKHKAEAKYFARLLFKPDLRLTVYPLALTLLLACLVTGYLYHRDTVTNLSQQMASAKSRQPAQSISDSTPIDDLLAQLDLASEYDRGGLLQLNRQRLLDYFLARSDAALAATLVVGSTDSGVPDYPQALAEIDRGLNYFPDSYRLLESREQLLLRRKQLADNMARELEARMLQGHFAAEAEPMIELHDGLQHLQVDSVSWPAGVMKTYLAELDEAVANHRPQALEHLVRFGENVFASEPAVVEKLQSVERIVNAGKLLADYAADVAKGGTATYPVAAAEIFYGQQFDQWGRAISTATDSGKLEPVYRGITALDKSLPVSLPRLVELKNQLANRYLRMSDQLMERRAFTTAKELLKRINELMAAPQTASARQPI